MLDIRNAVLATLAYHDVIGYPLTMREVHRLLINPARIQLVDGKIRTISIGSVADELARLTASGRIAERNGLYVVSGDRLNLCESRIAREKIAARKWKKLTALARWFQIVPFLRGVFVTGSLAIGNSSDHGDFDVLVVTSSGRLYTSRLFLSLVASILGVRRKRSDLFAPDKFCFNHYLTERSLAIPHDSLYAAYAYANIVPVLADAGLTTRFYTANTWLNGYLYNFKPSEKHIRRTVAKFWLCAVARIGEFMLAGRLGDTVETVCRFYQHKRIRENPITFEKGGRVVFNDEHLEFHPHSSEPAVIARYNSNLRAVGVFAANREHVSVGIE